jgi:alpha-L-fucosidase
MFSWLVRHAFRSAINGDSFAGDGVVTARGDYILLVNIMPARILTSAYWRKRMVNCWKWRCLNMLGVMLICIALPVCAEPLGKAGKYDYSWESLKTHPVPKWFDDAKFGIFIHWGPYSVIGHRKGGRGYAEWTPRKMYEDPEYYYPYLEEHFGGHPPEFGYKDIITLFTAEHFDPEQWAELFEQAGARYVVPVAEHHDGYAMWDSDRTRWCATQVGPMRDLIGELGAAVRAHGMKYAPSFHRERHPGYYAQPLYAIKATPFPDIATEIEAAPEAAELYGPFEYDDAFIADYVARWTELRDKYRPDFMWLDHIPIFHKRWNKEPDHPQVEKFRNACMRMIADYYNAAEEWGKEVYVNNKGPSAGMNWPEGVGCREGDNMKTDSIWAAKWQNPATLGTSYGYMIAEETLDAYKSPTELVHLLCDVVSKNGNLLLNIGPRADGTIPEGMQTRLLAIGTWLETNGEAIYGTRPWDTFGQEKPDLRFTTKGDALYAILLERVNEPFFIQLDEKTGAGRVTTVSLLGSDNPLEWHRVEDRIRITPPGQWPGSHAWTFRIQLNAIK